MVAGPDAAGSELNRRLQNFYERGPAPALVILPSQLRDGTWFYSEADLEAAKAARVAGVDAAFLDPPDERRYVAEYSAEIVFEMAIAVLANISADAVIAVGRYVLTQLSILTENSLLSGRSTPKVLVRAKRIDISDGRFTAEDLEIVATGDTVATEIARVLSQGRDTHRRKEVPRADGDPGPDPIVSDED